MRPSRVISIDPSGSPRTASGTTSLPSGFRCLLARWDEPGRARVEEALRLVAGTLDDLVRVERAGDGGDGLDERLEEARLSGQLVFGRLVPPALGDDQKDREGAGERGRRDQARRGEQPRGSPPSRRRR